MVLNGIAYLACRALPTGLWNAQSLREAPLGRRLLRLHSQLSLKQRRGKREEERRRRSKEVASKSKEVASRSSITHKRSTSAGATPQAEGCSPLTPHSAPSSPSTPPPSPPSLTLERNPGTAATPPPPPHQEAPWADPSRFEILPLPLGLRPVLVFVNGRSGKQDGKRLCAGLRRLLHPLQVAIHYTYYAYYTYYA
jgi:hypothetical protein